VRKPSEARRRTATTTTHPMIIAATDEMQVIY
jgi:hypothetical protein